MPRVPMIETEGRSIPEWIGATPDTPVPERVQLRVLLRQNRLCALTGLPIRPGVKPQCDHIKRLKDGGENRERNLQMVLAGAHQIKSATEQSDGARVNRQAAKANGLHESKHPMAKKPKPAKATRPVANGVSEIQRRFV